MELALSVNTLSKSFGAQKVLSEVSFELSKGEKLGLIGQNGTGKSTLLNIVYGLERPDQGEVCLAKDLSMGYMTQESALDPSKTLLEAVSAPTGVLGILAKKIKYLEKKLESSSELTQKEVENTSVEYAKAMEEFAASGGFGHPSKAEGTLEKLGFGKRHFNTLVGNLSGGEMTKARLARIVLEAEGTDMLLLDEPTNHLDIETTEWLEAFLGNYKGAILMVSHDRYLLDAVVTKIVELEGSHSKVYKANYSQYVKKKAEEFERHQTMYKRQQKEIRRQEEMIEFMHRVYTYSSLHKTRQKMLDRMEKVEKLEDHTQHLRLDFGKAEKSGKDMVDAKGVSKSYGNTLVFGKSDFRIERGDRVGLIGPNGSGKTTLVRLIIGKEALTSGEIKVSRGTDIGYYDQEHDGLVRDNTLLQEVRKEKRDASEEWVRGLLARFFFRGRDVHKKVFVLSGGERARLSIAKLLLSRHNMLILDEPTNYLDVYAKAAVEAALVGYEGTLLVISHDRALLDNVTTTIFELREQKLTVYPGGFSEYRRRRDGSIALEGGQVYEVSKKFTDWVTGRKYKQGECLRITEGQLNDFMWALENGYLVKGRAPKK